MQRTPSVRVLFAAAAALLAVLSFATPARATTMGRGTAGSALDAGRSGPPPPGIAQPVGTLPGIDVSHWQGAIDWSKVAAAGQRFVIAKATEGRTYVDPMYASYKAGAAAEGLAFTAYHFARPNATANDAILEADHFVQVAQLGPGNLVPVLDLEQTGGLTPEQLTQWVLDWLGEVTARLGVRPMVYTSPNGWKARMADTTAIADAGYTILWVAHWNVSSPTVPANDWQGYGWTFWQHTDCATVSGISGCVDHDWYAGTSFDRVTIGASAIDTTPPTATIAPPSNLDGPVQVSFSEVVRGVTTSNVVVVPEGAIRPIPATLTCRSKSGAVVGCVTGNVISATLSPVDPLVPGQVYLATVDPPGAVAVADRAGNPAPPTTATFDPPTDLEERSPALRYAWATVSDRRAYGGSYAVERDAGATASFPFSGRSVTWYTVVGPTQGLARVSIDGARVATVNGYAPSARFRVARTFDGLARGPHTITVTALGKAGSSGASDRLVSIDGFRIWSGVVKTPPLQARWASVRSAAASGGSVAVSDVAGASVSLTFRGTGVDWVTATGPDRGRAQVYLDGALVKTVNGYATKASSGIRSIGGLADGLHTLRIDVLGTSRRGATDALVTIDRFEVA